MTKLTLTRKEAAALNRTRFYTGRPCLHGHSCERYTASGNCVECARLRSKEQAADYRRRPAGAVDVPPQVLHPADAAALYDWIDAVNKVRGFPLARRPEGDLTLLTPWEQMLALEMRQSARMPLDEILKTAARLDIPETYSPGSAGRPVDTWSPTPLEIGIRHRAQGAGRSLTESELTEVNASRVASGRPPREK